jgi:hypothetical protein
MFKEDLPPFADEVPSHLEWKFNLSFSGLSVTNLVSVEVKLTAPNPFDALQELKTTARHIPVKTIAKN